MEWYSGDVTSALNIYQEKKGILIVYVYSDDANSTKFDQIWNSFDHSILNHVPYVAIHLAKDAEGAIQFAQFFPTPVFPVCYILGLNAQPLEVVTAVEEMTVERLNSSISKAISLYGDQMMEQGLTPAATSPQSEKKTNEDGQNISENTNESLGGPTNDEKLEYYRKRLEEKHKEDIKKKEQEEREKELMRRNEGKSLAEAREKQRERELKELADQRRKEKDEDAQALKRIRDQLRQDKEERAKRIAGGATQTESVGKAPEVEPTGTPVNSAQCRIQCKFPDGSTLTEVFPSDSPLQLVHDAISCDERAPPNFFLVQPYPRRKLNEFDKTLLELDLTPSSAILVLAQTKVQQSILPSNGYLNMVFGVFHLPLYFLGVIYHYFTSMFGGRRAVPISDQQQQTRKQNSTGRQKKDDASKTERNGNVGRFRVDESDNSDNEGTWNGNSTQQL